MEKAVDANEFKDRGENLQGPSRVIHAATRGSGQVFLLVSQVDSACYVRSGLLFVALVCTRYSLTNDEVSEHSTLNRQNHVLFFKRP